MSNNSTPSPVRFLFVDAGVADTASLLANVDPAIQVVRLTADEDGLTQIARALAGASDVGAVHVVSHGGPGALTLGSGRIDAASLDGHADALATIRSALADSADLLFYGCNVAEGLAGQAFINRLAEATGADVAASTDATGSSMLGGDWELEASTGTIEAAPLPLSGYEGLLGTDGSLPSGLQGSGPWNWNDRSFQTRYDGELSDNDAENPLRAGNKWDRYALDGVTAGTTVYVYMGNSSNVDDFLQIERNGSIITQNDNGGDGEHSDDAFVSWVYQPGDVIRATTYSPDYRGTYSLYIGTSSGVTATPTAIGSAPAPLPPQPTAPTFTDGYSLIATHNDTGEADAPLQTVGTLTASDSTPTGSMAFTNTSGPGTYGTLAVASNGNFVYTPDADALNALAAGVNASDTFTVRVTDGGLASTKEITVNVVGANDAPKLASNATIPAIAEDATVNPGSTVAAMFAPRFVDVDNGAHLAGIVIVGDASNGTQGRWEYSTDSGDNWHAVSGVSDTGGLVLAADALLRFGPVSNWSGTPGSLTVHAVDNTFAGEFTSIYFRSTFDTTNDAATSGVSVESRTVSTSVTAVNDAPTFTDANPISIGLGETAEDDLAPSLTSGMLSGTLAGTDVEAHTLRFGIRGADGIVDSTVQRTGSFGILTVHTDTGAWSYTPTHMTGINALPEGVVATDMFEVKVIDELGAESVKTLSVNITGSNDQPVLVADINTQSFNGGVGGWKFQIPANTFADAEGLGFTYTVDVIDGNGEVIDSITTAQQQGTSPSDWLSFDAASRTLSGTPPPGGAPMMIFRVTATDSENQVVTSTFQLNLPRNVAPVSTNDRVSVEYGQPYSLTLADFGAFLDAEGAQLAAVSFTSRPNGLLYNGLSPINTGEIFTRADIEEGRLQLTSVTSPLYFSFRVSDGYNFSPSAPSYRLAVDVHQGVVVDPGEPGVIFADTSVTTLVRDTMDVDTWTNVYTTDALSGIDGMVEVVVGVAGGTFLRLSELPDGLVDFNFTIEAPSGADLFEGTATNVTFSGPQATVNAVLRVLQVQPDPITPGIVRVDLSVTDSTTSEVATRSITLSPGRPSLNLAADAYYAANGEAQALNPELALSLADQTHGALTSATVQLFNREQGDVLGFVENPITKGDITGQYDGDAGRLTLTSAGGEATLEQWTTALQSITFQALFGSSASTRYLTWTVNDGNSIGFSSPSNTRIFITPANEEPTVIHLADRVIEPGDAVSFTIDGTFSDTDSQGITYSATLADGSDLPQWLVFDPQARTFNGNPPAGTPSLDIQVVGTDTDGGANSSTFSLILASANLASSAANNAGTVTDIIGTPTQGQELMVGQPVDGDGVPIHAPVSYQWQVKIGDTWTDIVIDRYGVGRGQGPSLVLEQSEAGREVRVQIFYTDAGGVAEAPFSNAVTVANLPETGTVVINGVLTPGETLVATVSDADGLANAGFSYQWMRNGEDISGATYSAYTLTNADGGAFISAEVSYRDDQNFLEVVTGQTESAIQLGVVAPVAVDDLPVQTAIEASGLGNAEVGRDASGNLLANDSDVNGNLHPTTPITGVRAGGIEGVGEAAYFSAGTYTVAGLYGTLTVNRENGAWTYAVHENDPSVEALFSGDVLQDRFNYTVADLTGLADTAVLTVTINGANDLATLVDLPTVAEFTEDITAAIRTSFWLVDPDGGSGSFALRLQVTQGTLRGENLSPVQGVVVTGTDTAVLTISAASVADVQAWLTHSKLLYTSASGQGDLNATLTWSVSDNGGETFREAGSTALTVEQANNPPVGLVTITGEAAQGQTLTASHTLVDSDGLGAVRYQWTVNGAMVAVGSSYVLSQADVGYAVTVQAYYEDGRGAEESVGSQATEPVVNSNDAPTGQVLIAGSVILGQTLVASNTLADIDGMGEVAYQWQADGVDIIGATGASHVLGWSDIGRAITVKAGYTDGFDRVESVASEATVPVADGNAVAPGVEQQVPGLGGGTNPSVQGDGNGDGVQDALQPGVVSAALDRTDDTGSSFVTLVVDSFNGTPIGGSQAQLLEFAPIDTAPALPSWAEAPVGEISFTADVGAAGATRNFSLYVDGDLGANGYWARNAEGTLVNLASEAYGGRTVVEGDKIRLDFQIVEGGEFDSGVAGDNLIVSQGSAAHASLSLIGYTADTPTNPGSGSMWD